MRVGMGVRVRVRVRVAFVKFSVNSQRGIFEFEPDSCVGVCLRACRAHWGQRLAAPCSFSIETLRKATKSSSHMTYGDKSNHDLLLYYGFSL